jgi:hypothetical protein
MIEIQLVGPKGLSSLTLLPESLKNNLFKGMQDGALLIERTSKVDYLSGPYPTKLTPDSGLLRQGVWAYAGLSGVAGEFGRIIAKSQQWYGQIHEQFGMPWIIYAKGKYMHFFWKHRNRWVKTKQVVIPPRPFLYPAIMDNIENIKILLNRMILQAYKSSGKI